MLTTLSSKEIAELERKINLPVTRSGKRKKVVPTRFTDREIHHIVFVRLAKLREENRKRFKNNTIQKHWTKMSKKQRRKQ